MESANPVLKGMFAAVAKIQLTPIGMVKNVFVLKVLVMAELVWIREFVVRNMLFVVKKLNVN